MTTTTESISRAPQRLDRSAVQARAAAAKETAKAEAAPRFSARSKWVLIVVLTLNSIMAVAAFATSFSGLFGAAGWAIGNTMPWLHIATPLMYDISIAAFTIKLFIDREEARPVIWTWFWILVLASVSATANVFHTLSVSTATTFPQLVMGCVISGGAPFLLALVTEVAASLVFMKSEVSKK